jgi:VWFA-related protein
MRKFAVLLVLLLLVRYPLTAWGQAPTPAPPGPVSVESPAANAARPLSLALTLDVVVTDESGKPVSGLLQQDFTLLDSKQPKPILSFRAIDQSGGASEPLQVVFVIDEVNSSARAISNVRQQLEKFLRQSDARLPVPVSLVFFADKSTQVQGAPTRNPAPLIAALKSADSSLRDFNQGFYVEVERLQRSLGMLGKLVDYEARQPGRKLVIWLSPGWPTLTLAEDQASLSPKDQENIFQSIVWLSTHFAGGSRHNL